MLRSEKEQVVSSLKETFTASKSVVVMHYRGSTVAEMTALRDEARENGVSVKVTKNTLAKIAAKDTPFEPITELLSGPTAVISSEDEVNAAKTVVKFSKSNENIAIIGGALGEEILDESGVKSLAAMPTLDESRAKIVGLLTAPATKIATLVKEPPAQLARVISAKGSES